MVIWVLISLCTVAIFTNGLCRLFWPFFDKHILECQLFLVVAASVGVPILAESSQNVLNARVLDIHFLSYVGQQHLVVLMIIYHLYSLFMRQKLQWLFVISLCLGSHVFHVRYLEQHIWLTAFGNPLALLGDFGASGRFLWGFGGHVCGFVGDICHL